MGESPIKMPQLGESVTEGTVDRWLKKVGDHVKKDEPLVEVVTDKVNAEIPSPFEGILIRIAVEEGTTIAIGTELAVIEVEGPGTASTPVAPPAAPEPPTVASPAAEVAAVAASEITGPAASAGGRFSPAVRRLAEENGIDPATIAGSGEGGRVTRDDVLAHLEQVKAGTVSAAAAPSAPPAAAPVPAPATPPAATPRPAPIAAGDREELVRLNAVRRSIAEHMVRSLATSPHVWTMVEVDMTALVKFREAEKDSFRQRNGVALTYLPFVTQVVCEALREFPFLNSTWTDDGIILKKYVNMGFAVAVPPDGLMVPVVHDADRLGFTDLTRAINDVVTRARDKKLKTEDVHGGTFTLNNTGATGSVASMPIINQPQAAILTTESITKRPVVIGDGIAVRSMMNMCMSFDHRILDGQMAGQFVNWIKNRLETWTPGTIKL